MRSTEGYTEWEAGPSKAGATMAASISTARTNSNNLYNRLHSAVAERVDELVSLCARETKLTNSQGSACKYRG